MVEFLQRLLHLVELGLGLFDGGLALLEADVVARLVFRARLVFVRAEVLQLFTAVFYFGQAEGGRGTFEEVAELRQLCEIS